jgi:putative peptidoglycan lipid II flippase
VAGWVEFALLRRTLGRRIGAAAIPASFLARLWLSALLAAAAAFGVKLAIGTAHPLVVGSLALALYGVVYLALTTIVGIPHARQFATRLLRRR